MYISNHIKNYEEEKELQKEIDYQKRLCNLYGICGTVTSELNLHNISHFGLKRLAKQKA